MADAPCSNLTAATPWTAGHTLQRALKDMSSELLQSSSAGMWARRCPPWGGEREFIQNPVSRLNPEMLYRQIQYVVREGDWGRQGEEVKEPSKTEERST